MCLPKTKSVVCEVLKEGKIKLFSKKGHNKREASFTDDAAGVTRDQCLYQQAESVLLIILEVLQHRRDGGVSFPVRE